MTAATIVRPYDVPKTGGGPRAIVLAIAMHALLGTLLFFGIRWQSSPPETIEAELWSAVPQTAAPAPRPVPPVVEAPRPEPKVVEPPPSQQPDIAEKVAPKVEKRKVEPPKVEQPKPQPTPPKVEAKARPEPAKPPAKPVVEAPARPPSDLANLLASAGDGTGRAPQTSGPRGDSKGYVARLKAAIRSQARYAATSAGNPVVKMRIEQLPTGEVVNVTVLASSGVPAFDAAIERAIRAASPLPRNDQGGVERELVIDYKMYDTP